MLRSDRLRVFKSSSHPKREGFHNTIKYKLHSTTKQSSKHYKKNKKTTKQQKQKKKKKPTGTAVEKPVKKEKREKKIGKNILSEL